MSRPTDEEIADVVIQMIKSGDASIKLQTIKKLGNNNLKRVCHALTSYLRELYGLEQKEAEPIVCLIQKDILA